MTSDTSEDDKPKVFRISVGDDPDYDDLTAEIYWKEMMFAMLTQEEGFENLRIQLFPCPSDQCWDVSLSEVTSAIEEAKKRLWELRRIC